MKRLCCNLFNALTAVSGLLLLAVLVLWVRSYWIQDQWNTCAGAIYRCIYSEYGVVAAFTQNDPANSGEWPWKHWASHDGGVGGIPYGHFLFTRTSQGWWLSYASVFWVIAMLPGLRGGRWVLYKTRVRRRALRIVRLRIFPPYRYAIARGAFRFFCGLALFSCVMCAISMLVSIDFGLSREKTFSPLLDHAFIYRVTSGRGGVTCTWCRRSYYYQDAVEAKRSRGSDSRDNQLHLRVFCYWFQGPYGGGESHNECTISFAAIKYDPYVGDKGAMITLPWLGAIGLFGVWPARRMVAYIPVRRRARRLRRGLCPACGYNLQGNVTGICPECGGGA